MRATRTDYAEGGASLRSRTVWGWYQVDAFFAVCVDRIGFRPVSRYSSAGLCGRQSTRRIEEFWDPKLVALVGLRR